MKKLLIFLQYYGLLFTACDSLPSIKNKTPELYTVSFNIQLLPEIIPFPESRSIPGSFPSEPVIDESNPVPVEEFSFDYIEYVIFNRNTQEIVDEERIGKNREDFGSYLYSKIPAGSFQITIITHSATETNRTGYYFYMEDPEDTFVGVKTFDIVPGTEKQEIKVNLLRKVSRVEFIATDAIPEGVTQFSISVPERYTTLNLLTGEATPERNSHLYEHLFTEKERLGEVKKHHAFYTLVPASESTLPQATLMVSNGDGEILRRKEVRDIPVYQNRITQYVGLLYTSDMADGTFELDFTDGGKWEDIDKYPLP